ncbi:cyclic GMP-AMP synthase DncV-like nucleotidyltransferase [Nitratiruptor sp. YY09-18]|uniref:cyclic GMP-AMP synthase DncV-like nucleotidyltransferase n=1 Tax=Nitratiruptor sp. YY09-18 TaxID=2724901 RepID=UPI0019156B62|nr:hypothetical protein [Nitratiruptor sp. YY09-18]BCD67602.1 hypothetical protein NitYY0918_C0501 [Nitratiruptor sp. YY09-18]
MDFDKQFKEYHNKIKLSSAKKKELIGDSREKGSRDALRDRIKKDFEEKGRRQPKFFMQGSFSMNTTINPLSAEYDLDDGVYLQNIDTSKSIEEWETPETVHKWIVEAVDGHTSKKPTDKNLCVRVHYADEKKHIDLPIYTQKENIYYLAVKGKGWIESDPKEIKDWFLKEVSKKGEQFRRIVRYMKGWKDFREDENNQIKLYGGFQLTVMTSYNYVSSDSDEESFYNTIKGIKSNLWRYEHKIPHPINDNKNIIEHYSETRRKKFAEEFEKMFENAKNAYEEIDCVEKSKKWQKIFGDRFPILKKEECEENNKEEEAARITGTTDITYTSERQA